MGNGEASAAAISPQLDRHHVAIVIDKRRRYPPHRCVHEIENNQQEESPSLHTLSDWSLHLQNWSVSL